jgi:outer membrane protein OmpA-like peptidoglycan-associated protein/flagellar hook assembly protein FlgD
MSKLKRLFVLLSGIVFYAAAPRFAAAELPPFPLFGADAAPELYSPALAGAGAFITSRGGAPFSAVNPAAGADAQRIVFDLGYLGLPGLGDEQKYGNVIEAGALFPTKFAAFGASLRLINSPFDRSFPIKTLFSGSLNAAKELYPGMSLGLGLNFGFGDEWILSGDLGFRYNVGDIGPFRNLAWAAVLRGMGKSWTPSWFTPVAGISFDIITVPGEGNKPDPFRLGFAADLGIPSVVHFDHISMTFKTGFTMTFGELFSISASWPGASGLNVRELAEGGAFPAIPSIGIGLDFTLKTGGRPIAGGRLPSDGDLVVNAAARPLYGDVWALGAGLSWFVGVLDKRPPLITLDYPETAYISPNNDGLADNLECPLSITDQRYIAEWIMELNDESGAVVRTYRNKERRPETQGVQNFIGRLLDVKSGVEVPPVLRWDGIFDSGDRAPDGEYTFEITAWDDNNNMAVSGRRRVVVDNTPPEIILEPMEDNQRIFSPDGDGNKDSLLIVQSGSAEDLWEGAVYDSLGNKVRSFRTEGEPAPLVWDGKDDEGRIVADGVYSYKTGATDRAKNEGGAGLENIIVNTIQPAVTVVIADAWFSPNGDGVKDTIVFSPGVPFAEGVTRWELGVRDDRGVLRRSLAGSPAPPRTIAFDGRDDQGALLGEGLYQGNLTVNYRNGYISTALSPSFTLDITPPRASARAGYAAFSPNNDGSQDEMILYQEGSSEVLWVGDIRRLKGEPGEPPVRSFRFSGAPPARISWDGHGDSGTFAADGEYTYRLYALDQAGNTGGSNTVQFTLSTADTPVMISADLRAFSPNGDGVRDLVSLNPVVQVRDGISSWKIEVLNGAGAVLRSFEGRNTVPAALPWDGRDNNGAAAPEGAYTAKIELRYVQGNQPRAFSLPFSLDLGAPEGSLRAPYRVFSPNGDGRRDFIPLEALTGGNDEWKGSVTDSTGRIIRTWNWTGMAPELSWDARDEAGNIVPDGRYRFTLESADEAGNSTRLGIEDIIVDARIPRVFLTSSPGAIAPRGGSGAEEARFGIICSIQDGIEDWNLELRDEQGTPLRVFAGNSAAPPGTVNWDGLAEDGSVREGRFTPVLAVRYVKGDLISVRAAAVTVDVTGPVLSFVSRPEYFSPDNDGVDDELIMNLGALDASPIASWSFEIREPRPPYPLFWRIEGRGSPAEETIWDGRSGKGELVQAATDYPFIFKAEDILGNAASLEGFIGVDVLVIRDGDRLRIQVPSIIFRENAADFNSLPADVVENNYRVLRRVAEILNKFRDYKVQVEGHANPVIRTEVEERTELQPLSEARARAVLGMLVEYGVARNRLSAAGRGGSRPVIRWEDRENWWKNRRVEFILIK